MKRAILLFALISAPAGAQTWSDSGLETANYKYVAVVIEGLDADERRLGLTKDRIRNRVELRLRSAGLTPGTDSRENRTALYVNVNATKTAYIISVEYQRPVDFTTGNQQYRSLAGTWQSSSVGTHVRSGAVIMNTLDQHLDKFLNEYLKANQK